MTAEFSGQKLFPADKNYILKEAQNHVCFKLLCQLRDFAVSLYYQQFNPLRLIDETTEAIERNSGASVENLLPFYYELAGIYRFKHGETQLEFLFDGRTHFDKYCQDWEDTFLRWIDEMGKSKSFIRAILEATVLAHGDMRVELLHQRLKWQLAQVFDMKVYKYRGIRELSVA